VTRPETVMPSLFETGNENQGEKPFEVGPLAEDHISHSKNLRLFFWPSIPMHLGMLVPSACMCAQWSPTLWDPIDNIAHQAPLSMGFSRREYWGGLPFPLSHSGKESPPPEVAGMIVYRCTIWEAP